MVQQQFEDPGMTRFNFQNGGNTPNSDVMYPMSSDVIGNHDNQPQGYHKSTGTQVIPEIPQKVQNEQDLKLSAHKEAIYKFVYLLYLIKKMIFILTRKPSTSLFIYYIFFFNLKIVFNSKAFYNIFLMVLVNLKNLFYTVYYVFYSFILKKNI